MPYDTTLPPPASRPFAFEIVGDEALSANTELTVLEFTGEEEMNQPFRFDILVAAERELDAEPLLRRAARFVVRRSRLATGNPGMADVVYHGHVRSIREADPAHGLYPYRIGFAATLARLSDDRFCETFQDVTIPDVIGTVLRQAGLDAGSDFSIQTLSSDSGEGAGPAAASCRRWGFLARYNESGLGFLQRLMEREGLAAYFRHEASASCLMVTDNTRVHTPLMPASVPFREPGGESPIEAIDAFRCKLVLTPEWVCLSDYNPDRPSQDKVVVWERVSPVEEDDAPVSLDEPNQTEALARKRAGTHYTHGVDFATYEEGHRLARLRADALRACRRRFVGSGTVATLHPGVRFRMAGHLLSSWNEPAYLVLRVEHRGSQAHRLFAGISGGEGPSESPPEYANRFTAMDASLPFRPVSVTERPLVTGNLTAMTDGLNTDALGRYKVRLAYDLEKRPYGKSSHWVRRSVPFNGRMCGWHGPLFPGTEVVLRCLEGNPDRPVIAHAMVNADAESRTALIDLSEIKYPTGSVFRTLASTRAETPPASPDAGNTPVPPPGLEHFIGFSTIFFGTGKNGGGGGSENKETLKPFARVFKGARLTMAETAAKVTTEYRAGLTRQSYGDVHLCVVGTSRERMNTPANTSHWGDPSASLADVQGKWRTISVGTSDESVSRVSADIEAGTIRRYYTVHGSTGDYTEEIHGDHTFTQVGDATETVSGRREINVNGRLEYEIDYPGNSEEPNFEHNVSNTFSVTTSGDHIERFKGGAFRGWYKSKWRDNKYNSTKSTLGACISAVIGAKMGLYAVPSHRTFTLGSNFDFTLGLFLQANLSLMFRIRPLHMKWQQVKMATYGMVLEVKAVAKESAMVDLETTPLLLDEEEAKI